jgi:cytochrome b
MSNKVVIWDLPLRIFHWSLFISVLTSIVSGLIGGMAMTLHFFSGYCIMSLLIFRWLWGFIGGYHARFLNFVAGPRRVLDYLREGSEHEELGHNPLGSWSVVALLYVLTMQVISGLFANDEIFNEGPLANYISDHQSTIITYYHTSIGLPLLYGLVGLHIAAILYYSIIKDKNLIVPMFDGVKNVDPAHPKRYPSADTWRHRLIAICILGVGAALGVWVSRLGAP